MTNDIKEKIYNLRAYLGIEENWLLDDIEDYITNLQEEINKLTSESTEWEERTYCWQDRAENLEIIIDKAIKYMNNYNELVIPTANIKSLVLKEEYKKIIHILQGEDNE